MRSTWKDCRIRWCVIALYKKMLIRSKRITSKEFVMYAFDRVYAEKLDNQSEANQSASRIQSIFGDLFGLVDTFIPHVFFFLGELLVMTFSHVYLFYGKQIYDRYDLFDFFEKEIWNKITGRKFNAIGNSIYTAHLFDFHKKNPKERISTFISLEKK